MYNQFYPQYMQQQNPYITRQQIVRVNGMGGAQAYQMMPNSSALLLDENNPLLYLAQTDGAGYKTVTTFKIETYNPEPQVTAESLEARIKKLEEAIYNGKSNSSNVRWKQAEPVVADTGYVEAEWKSAADA